MKIVFFVTEAGVLPNAGSNVSAHLQIPLHSMHLLREAGHSVELITTQSGPGEVWPACLPAGIKVHEIVDARRKRAGRSTVHPARFLIQLRQIRSILERERYDVVHFHGSCRLPNLAALLSRTGVKACMVVTVNNGDVPVRAWFLRRLWWKPIASFMTSTDFFAERLRSHGIPVEVIRHGTVRDLRREMPQAAPAKRWRVLYWRDASFTNGIDICLAVFGALAMKFPHVSFDVAVRDDHWEDWIPAIRALAGEHPNIHVHVFPYESGVTLPQLVAESICVVLPFRRLSYHPQLSVLESVQYGTLVVASALESNVEVAEGGRNAALVPVGDVAATIACIESVLKDSQSAYDFAQRAMTASRAVWNWDNYISQLTGRYAAALARKQPSP